MVICCNGKIYYNFDDEKDVDVIVEVVVYLLLFLGFFECYKLLD